MSKIKVVLNKNGVKQMLLSEAVKNMVFEQAQTIQKRCGEGYKAGFYRTPNRWVARVTARTVKARAENAENNTILKAVR